MTQRTRVDVTLQLLWDADCVQPMGGPVQSAVCQPLPPQDSSTFTFPSGPDPPLPFFMERLPTQIQYSTKESSIHERTYFDTRRICRNRNPSISADGALMAWLFRPRRTGHRTPFTTQAARFWTSYIAADLSQAALKDQESAHLPQQPEVVMEEAGRMLLLVASRQIL